MEKIICGEFAEGDRVVWTAGPAYGGYRGPGALYGFMRYSEVLYGYVRFDDPGLDDKDIPMTELRREA